MLKRRAFFASVFGAGAITANASVIKPKDDGIMVMSYSAWMCADCGYATWCERENPDDYNSARYVMWCCNKNCKNFEIKIYPPKQQAILANLTS